MQHTNIPKTKEKILHFLSIVHTNNLRIVGKEAKVKDVMIKYLKEKEIIKKGRGLEARYHVVREPTDNEIIEAIKIKQAENRKQYSKRRGGSQTTTCNIILEDRFVMDAY